MIRIALEAKGQTIRGILKYKRRNGKRDWQFPLIMDYRSSLTAKDLRAFKIDAAIGYLRESPGWTGWLRDHPAVNLGGENSQFTVPSTPNDDFAIGVLAGEHVIELGLPSHHFVTLFENETAANRFAGFKSVLEKHNHHPDYHLLRPKGGSTLIRRKTHNPASFRPLLKRISLPAAVMCVNDECAFSLITACTLEGIRVPDDVCVVGVNNDAVYSRLTDPMVTTVNPDLVERGYKAAELLDHMLSGKSVPPVPHVVRPEGIILRGSTYRLQVDCAEVATAMKFIGAHANDHITAGDVVAQVPYSRRSLEMKFKQHLGRTIMEEIVFARFRIARKLLETTDMILDEVAYRSGFPNPARLQAAVKKYTGKTAAALRRKN